MEKLTQFRAHIVLLLFVGILGLFAFRIYDKQVY